MSRSFPLDFQFENELKLTINYYLIIIFLENIMSRSHATPSPEAGRGTLRPHLVQTSAHTWVCVGEDVSNMGMIRGKDGIVIIDTGMHPECAARTLATVVGMS